MLASTWPMKSPMHTVPTTNQRYEASRAMARRGGGSRPLSTASRSAAIEAGPGDESVTSAFGSRSASLPGARNSSCASCLFCSARALAPQKALPPASTKAHLMRFSAFELLELAHERRGDSAVQLAVEDERPVPPPAPWPHLLPLLH